MSTQVYFATNRNPIQDSPVPNNFGTDFNTSGEVTYGRASIKSVDDESEIGNSNFKVDGLRSGAFLDTHQEGILAGTDHLLIYLHGFDYRFREAVMRAGSLGKWFVGGSAKVATTVIAFTWPSLGSLSIDAYKTDYQNATASSGAFRRFVLTLLPLLREYRKRNGKRRVTLMAHSMGNHFLHEGLRATIGSAPGQVGMPQIKGLIDQAFLLAADEDADSMSRGTGLSSLLDIAGSVHLYYNNMDIPLNIFSRPVHGVARLGIDGPSDKVSFRGKSISFVNCSAANPEVGRRGERLDPQWHQYYRLVPEVRDDICRIMHGQGPEGLPNRVHRSKENYFRLNLARRPPSPKGRR